MQVDKIIQKIKKLGDPKVKKTKERFAIYAENSYGIFLKDIQVLAKEIGSNDNLAIKLFDTGIYEARLLVPHIFNPNNLTSKLMDKWVQTFENWEICDTFCMGFFGVSPHAYTKALTWPSNKGEYQKRAGFVCMVSYAFTNKDASNDDVRKFFSLIVQHAQDERKYVMKGINWALRQIAKRNSDLYQEAIDLAHHIKDLGGKEARWIANDALRQLKRPKISMKNYPRSIYGKK
ncbi:MAG: DNA alkylation repair protein [Alphaproteobacteria bacterium]|nr:DNA alkylation repair protein [Alphaproteobacteria bacterium]